MLSLLLRAVITAAFLGTLARAQYQCVNAYNPSNYVGNTRVPPNCTLETLECPRSWKAGIPQGQSLALPLIDVNFVQCHEGFLCCGYVPINNTNGQVLGTSGVTVGSGVDLGSKTSSSLRSIGVPQTIVDQLSQYFGLKRDDAACAVIELPLRMSCNDAQALTEAVKNDNVLKVQQRYDQDRRRVGEPPTEPFHSLPRGIRTAVADVWFQFGSSATPRFTFWNYVTSNDWENAVKELRNFYQNVIPPRGDIIRRNNEADIIEAALARCNRSADIVFLVDESGSIDDSDFTRSLNFVESITDAFPEETLRDENGTRFGLSLFSSLYRDRFYLSTYTSKSQYISALGSTF